MVSSRLKPDPPFLRTFLGSIDSSRGAPATCLPISLQPKNGLWGLYSATQRLRCEYLTINLILDGQQRLATATILLAALRDKIRGFNENAANQIQSNFISFEDHLTG